MRNFEKILKLFHVQIYESVKTFREAQIYLSTEGVKKQFGHGLGVAWNFGEAYEEVNKISYRKINRMQVMNKLSFSVIDCVESYQFICLFPF